MKYRPSVVCRAAAATTVTFVSKVATAFCSAGQVGTAAAVAAAAAAAAASSAQKKSEPAKHGQKPKPTRLRHGEGKNMKEV